MASQLNKNPVVRYLIIPMTSETIHNFQLSPTVDESLSQLVEPSYAEDAMKDFFSLSLFDSPSCSGEAPTSEQPRKPAGNRAPLPIRQAKAAPARNFARTSSDRRTANGELLSLFSFAPARTLYIRFSIFLVDLVPDGGIESCLLAEAGEEGNCGYSGASRDRNGVDILVGRIWGASGARLRINDRLMMVKLVIGGCTLSVISAYAPQVGLDEARPKLFTRIWMRKGDRGLFKDRKVIPVKILLPNQALVMDTEIKRAGEEEDSIDRRD
ncbi:hypothetical protein H5410_019264 [Solanum commersonii]|uniref:Uncharacterized protein n=1 Tax=Solanum commersonii TaxID=4109 RepID=A0A9J6A4Y5_SOLCO|nr:hypothetical protein H5410_019264 [Solanum commersonii]